MKVARDAPSRPALRYHGAKWLLAPWIIQHLPAHELYCEPFGGSAAVLLRKERSLLECWNDLDGEVVNFFKVLRERPEKLIRAIELTPFAKVEWTLSSERDQDPVESARRFYIRSYMSIAGPTAQWNTGWRRQKVFSRGTGGESKMTPAALSFKNVEHLWTVASRLRGVQIECDDALAVVERYDTPETVFYLDPPYVAETRGRWKDKAYAEEMDEEDHEKLAETLLAIEGMAVLSGYRSDLYDRLFAGWKRIERPSRTNGSGSRTECLWLSPGTTTRRQYLDLPLFQDAGSGGT
jgi:DNA adenine methylase